MVSLPYRKNKRAIVKSEIKQTFKINTSITIELAIFSAYVEQCDLTLSDCIEARDMISVVLRR